MDKSWMSKNQRSREYRDGVKGFIDLAKKNSTFHDGDGVVKIRCPCIKCTNTKFQYEKDAIHHLLWKGIMPTYTNWTLHGESYVSRSSSTNVFQNVDEMEDIVFDVTGARGWDGDDVASEEVDKFNRLLKECEKSLYPGCNDYSKMSYIVELLHIKCLYKISNSGMCKMLEFFKKCLPTENTAPGSYREAKKFVADLGLGYRKIDACKNDCILYYKEYEHLDACPFCKESRWQQPRSSDSVAVTSGSKRKKMRKKVSVKSMPYFPLIPRLQRLFMSEKTADSMRWHEEGRNKDGVLRHPADTKAWKALDNVRPSFAAEPRNIRLGIASDGFNPFSGPKPYSMWPVILIPYNMSPNECMKDPNYFLSMIIPGPTSPGNDIDVFLQPLIDELKQLWEDGVRTYDASRKEHFQLHAAILWTINDFPAYGNLSGWCTSGFLACPICGMETCHHRLKFGRKQCFMGSRRFLPSDHPYRANRRSFDGQEDHRPAPRRLSGDEVLTQLEHLEKIPFGKTQKKLSIFGVNSPAGNWKKTSIFFQLPYWKSLLLRHNLDVMHIEKNVCENIMNILLDVKGKSNDNLNARKDLQVMGIKRKLHPQVKGRKTVIPPACYTLNKKEKAIICQFLRDLTVPGGFSSNISRCVKVKEQKISGLKSHDYHVLMQRLLPIALRSVLPKTVCSTLIKLCKAFSILCAKELREEDLEQLELDLPIIMCDLERLFPPAFFDITVHLVIHLVEEAGIGGPVQFSWMYFIERIMGVMKSFVNNRRYPEASIAEGFLAMECATFCSRYLHDVETKFTRTNQVRTTEDASNHGGLDIFSTVGKPIGGCTVRRMSTAERSQCHLYILQNCAEAQPYLEQHKSIQLQKKRKTSARSLVLEHNNTLADWFENRVAGMNHVQATLHDKQMHALGSKPALDVRSFSAYEVNGFKFHTKDRASRRSVQNCGVMVSAGTMCFAKKSDQNPVFTSIDYYGTLIEVVEVQYRQQFRVVLFKCEWYDVVNRRNVHTDDYGFTWVKNTTFMSETEPFILASQARQIFYAKDPLNKEWSLAVLVDPRKQFDMGLHTLSAGIDPFQEVSTPIEQVRSFAVNDDMDDIFECNRPDMEGIEIDIPVVVAGVGKSQEFINDDDLVGNETDNIDEHEIQHGILDDSEGESDHDYEESDEYEDDDNEESDENEDDDNGESDEE